MKLIPKHWIIVMIAFLVGGYGVALGWLATAVQLDTKQKADVVIVLGAKAKWGDRVNPCLEARVNEGVELIKQNYAPKLIVSGGVDQEDGSIEAEVMMQLAIEKGLNEGQVVTEPKATSTFENLEFSHEIMTQNGFQTAIIVSEPFHLPRASLVAQEIGLKATVSPAEGSPCWERWKYLSRYFLKEPFNIGWYWVTGRI